MYSAQEINQENGRNFEDGNQHVNIAKFSFLVTMAFTLNYIIGAGFLTIPSAFNETGWILGFLGLFFLLLISIVSSNFLVETLARASYAFDPNRIHNETLAARNRDSRMINGSRYQAVGVSNNELVFNPISSFEIDSSNHTESDKMTPANTPPPILVGQHTFEITELCQKFLGEYGVLSYSVFIILYFYGTLWGYSSVFANAFNSIFGGGYNIFLLLFACFAVPISLLEFTEQVQLQVCLSYLRVILLCVMVGTLLLSWSTDTEAFTEYPMNTNATLVSRFRPSRLYKLLPVVTYAFIFHHSIPALSHPVSDKSQVGNIFTASLGVCFVAYALVGIVLSLYFGDAIRDSSNLCWFSYVGNTADSANSMVVQFARFLSKFVVLFPAFDVASAFPLNAITLGNSLENIMHMRNQQSTEVAIEPPSPRIKRIFRLIASVPPIIGAYFIHNLGSIVHYTGLCGFGIAFVFPPLLSIASERYMIQHGLPVKTAYSMPDSIHRPLQYFTAGLGLFFIVYVFVCNLIFKD